VIFASLSVQRLQQTSPVSHEPGDLQFQVQNFQTIPTAEKTGRKVT
jgi:hypothetical protein